MREYRRRRSAKDPTYRELERAQGRRKPSAQPEARKLRYAKDAEDPTKLERWRVRSRQRKAKLKALGLPTENVEKRKVAARKRYTRYMGHPEMVERLRGYRRKSKKVYAGKYPERVRKQQWKRNLRVKYGVTPEWYGSVLAAQGGGCAVCGSPNPGTRRMCFLVDHDHETGAARGLLCLTCNTGIGNLKDDPRLLRLAAAYLERYARVLESQSA